LAQKVVATQAVTDRDEQIANLNQTLAERDGQIANSIKPWPSATARSSTSTRPWTNAMGRSLTSTRPWPNAMGRSLTSTGRGRTRWQIVNLNQAVAERDGHIAALYNSTSWRMTLPLRIVAHQMKRIRRVAELAMPAIRHGGGIKNTFRKALRIYQNEGLSGIKRGFRLVATSQIPC